MSMHLHELLNADTLDLSAIDTCLNNLDASERLVVVRSVGKNDQRRLYEATEGRGGLTLDYMVPSSAGDLSEVIHEGRNSLPLFTLFQKRFCRVSSSSSALSGYNEQSNRWITGPGYFVAREIEGGEIDIDYTELPTEKDQSWPEILPQSARLGRFVYMGMIDRLHRVSDHVTVGRAFRNGKVTDNYFLLCRQDP